MSRRPHHDRLIRRRGCEPEPLDSQRRSTSGAREMPSMRFLGALVAVAGMCACASSTPTPPGPHASPSTTRAPASATPSAAPKLEVQVTAMASLFVGAGLLAASPDAVWVAGYDGL